MGFKITWPESINLIDYNNELMTHNLNIHSINISEQQRIDMNGLFIHASDLDANPTIKLNPTDKVKDVNNFDIVYDYNCDALFVTRDMDMDTKNAKIYSKIWFFY